MMLQILNLTYRIAGRTLFEAANLSLPAGHHAGLVGPNGSGKSTLLKLISGELHADAGEIRLPGSTRVGMLAQEAPDGERSLLETVLAADRERSQLLAAAERAVEPESIASVHARLADIEAHRAPAKAAAILAGLGLDEAAQARPCSHFSGGWRMRVALAAVLFAEPDLLLLDEPTNHLDIEATLWLEGFLKVYPRCLILVSHDRDLLNSAASKIIHIETGKLCVYTGGYDRFAQARAERIGQLANIAAKQAARRRHMQAFIDRFRYKASKARQAQSRLKALARMKPVVTVTERAHARFEFPTPEPLPPPIVALDNVQAGYEAGRPVLRQLDLRLDMSDRVALLGANGNGKSTLIKLLAGRIEPLTGEVRRSSKLKVGYFAQQQQDEIDPALTPLELMARGNPRSQSERHRAHFARFGLGAGQSVTPVEQLSGGERARLLFALMTIEAPHLLLLDEPTNHLDMDAREALIEALNKYEGAVVLVSHDPHLIRLTVDQLWLVADGRCTPFEGDLDDYRRRLDQPGRQTHNLELTSAESRKRKRRLAAEARAQTIDLRRAAADAERRLQELEIRRVALERRLADPAAYDQRKPELTALQIEFDEVQKLISAAEEEWLRAQNELDAASAR
jgi:ATP-binding cassette, subfamily F, member 3